MFAAYGRHTQAGIERRKAERRLAQIEQDNKPQPVAPVLKLVDPVERTKDEPKPIPPLPVAKVPIEKPPFRHTLRLIEDRICRVFKITRQELHSQCREPRLCLARHAVMYWACRLTSLSLPDIARRMNRSDHSGIHHARVQYPKKRAKHGRYLRPAR